MDRAVLEGYGVRGISFDPGLLLGYSYGETRHGCSVPGRPWTPLGRDVVMGVAAE